MKTINRITYTAVLERNCNKQKHRFRTNEFGVVWCVCCGKLADGDAAANKLLEEDKFNIKED